MGIPALQVKITFVVMIRLSLKAMAFLLIINALHAENATAQHRVVDSLRIELNKEKPKAEKAEILNYLAFL